MKIVSKKVIIDRRNYWDITVPETHNFVLSNGIVVHNCGTGVGFSVERQFIAKLPEVNEEFYDVDTTIVVKDNRIGWASGLRQLISLLYQGQVPKWDLTNIRPEGAPLKTFGGRASGPKPLNELFLYTVHLFKKAAGRKLTSTECHDLMCKIADVVVCGGVRRSALISLSNLSDERMRHAKNGQWWIDNPQRQLANNSVAYTEKPEMGIFMDEWKALYESKSGERGIFNRQAAKKKMKKFGRRDTNYEFGVNPCGEILLRPQGLCNLSEAVCRYEDSKESLMEKVEIAAIIGTYQATLTNFRYIRSVWAKNCNEERLLGVSLTGVMDCPLTNCTGDQDEQAKILQDLRDHAIETNKEWAEKIGINPATAVTTNKPSGTVSELVRSSSGIHGWIFPVFKRNVRNDIKDPLCDFLISQGIPNTPDLSNPKSIVFSFPMKAPETSIIAGDLSAIKQLEQYLMFSKNWAEHNPSTTIYVKEDEWLEVGAWVYKHFDSLNGVSFLPYSDSIYQQQPFEPITEEAYESSIANFPKIDWDSYNVVELEDNVKGTQTLACVSGTCFI